MKNFGYESNSALEEREEELSVDEECYNSTTNSIIYHFKSLGKVVPKKRKPIEPEYSWNKKEVDAIMIELQQEVLPRKIVAIPCEYDEYNNPICWVIQFADILDTVTVLTTV